MDQLPEHQKIQLSKISNRTLVEKIIIVLNHINRELKITNPSISYVSDVIIITWNPKALVCLSDMWIEFYDYRVTGPIWKSESFSNLEGLVENLRIRLT